MVIKNVFWQVLEKVVRLSVTVLVSALLARYLGPDTFGRYNYLNAIVTIAIVITSLGLNRIIVREAITCQSKKEHSELVSTALFLRMGVSLLAIAIISIYFTLMQSESLIYVLVFSSIIFVSFDVIDYHLQGESIFKLATTCRMISFVSVSLIRILMLYMSVDDVYFYVTIFLEYAFSGILIYCANMMFYRQRVSISFGNFSFKRSKELLKESWPEIIAGFGAILFMKLDQIMLQHMQGDASVGIYSAATRLSEAWYFVPTAIVAATFPVFMNKHKEGSAGSTMLLQDIKKLMTVLIWLSIVIGCIINVFGSYAIEIIYGEQYLESSDILKLHVWGGLFLCMGITSGSWLVAEKKLKLNLYRNLFGLVINFALNLILIPIYGATGAAMATVIGLAAAFLFFDLFHPQLREMFWLKCSCFSPMGVIRTIKFLMK